MFVVGRWRYTKKNERQSLLMKKAGGREYGCGRRDEMADDEGCTYEYVGTGRTSWVPWSFFGVTARRMEKVQGRAGQWERKKAAPGQRERERVPCTQLWGAWSGCSAVPCYLP